MTETTNTTTATEESEGPAVDMSSGGDTGQDVIIDFSSVNADEFSTVPPGEYDCTVKKVTIRQKDDPSKQTYPYLNFELTIDEGQDFAGAPLYFIASLSPEKPKGNFPPPINRAKFLLLTFGVDLGKETRLSRGPDGTMVTPNLVGMPCHAWVARDTYQGQPQAKVTRLRGKEWSPENDVKPGTPRASAAAAESRYK